MEKGMGTGTRLKQLRKERKLSGYKMAERLGLSVAYYYELEKGEKRLNEDLINKIADTFDVSTDYLLGRDEKRNDEKTVNIKEVLEDSPFKQYHWDGIPLDEEALKEAKAVIEYFLKKKENKNTP